MIEDKINLLLQLGAEATYLDTRRYGELCALAPTDLARKEESESLYLSNDIRYDAFYSFDYVIAEALGIHWNVYWKNIFDTEEKIINLYRATVLIERHYEFAYIARVGFSHPTTSIVYEEISRLHLDNDGLIDWVKEHKSSNEYSDPTRFIRSSKYPVSKIEKSEPRLRAEAIKLIEKKYNEKEQSSHKRIILDTIQYRDDINTDILQDMLEGKLKRSRLEGKPIRLAFFSDDQMFNDIAPKLRNYSLSELQVIQKNNSSRRLKRYIDAQINSLEKDQ